MSRLASSPAAANSEESRVIVTRPPFLKGALDVADVQYVLGPAA